MINCNTISIPELESEPCNGEYFSTQCVIHAPALSSLNLPANSPQSDINTAFLLVLTNLNEQIAALQERVTTLENPS
jgi:hypothetical protein